jgi:hypothetical protein
MNVTQLIGTFNSNPINPTYSVFTLKSEFLTTRLLLGKKIKANVNVDFYSMYMIKNLISKYFYQQKYL